MTKQTDDQILDVIDHELMNDWPTDTKVSVCILAALRDAGWAIVPQHIADLGYEFAEAESIVAKALKDTE